ncbi:MFS transporter [Legionella worsleiensis]|uniref:Major Facilitator Superfamily protein n=1 Tax=Legionella worsleiensis TaxID=45076 RepID=A0A0W1A6H5_9GAMM|nr:MFS transporter [Legionella worsleiensis]KTD76902.1 Major Facilitator Superfamily protein [Legionella worsleiensis]STY33428.1 Major Facilitator Superfamily [Legionella worsleiensis]
MNDSDSQSTDDINLEDRCNNRLTVIDSERNNVPIISSEIQLNGSFTQSYIVDVLASYSTRSASSAVMTTLMGMRQLNQALAGLLIVSPIVLNLLTYIPMTWRVHKTGGKMESLILMTTALAGMSTITILFSCTDMSSVSGFDWRYGVMLAAGFLTGSGTVVNLLMIDTLKWVPKKSYVPNLQLLYTFLVDSATVTTPLATYFLSQFGFYVPFAIFSGLLLVGGLTEWLLGNPSPYHQFKAHYPHETSKQFSINRGQSEDFLAINYDDVSVLDVLKDNLSVLFDRRSLLLGMTLFASLGSFFVSRTILPRLLGSGFGLTTDEAIITTSLANLITITARPIAAKLILYLDTKSGGVKIHVFGCGLAIIGSAALAAGNLTRLGLYTSLALSNTGFGINMATPLSIASSNSWSTPGDRTLKRVNPSTMFGLFGTVGALGGIMLPILLGLLVDESGEKWYKEYFYFIMSLMLVSAIGVPIIHYQVTRRPGDSLLKSALSFFGKTFNHAGLQQYAVRNEPEEDIEGQENRNQVYVDAFI